MTGSERAGGLREKGSDISRLSDSQVLDLDFLRSFMVLSNNYVFM